MAPKVPISMLERLVGVREAVNAIEAMHDGVSGQRMPHFDYLSLSHCAKVLESFPHASFPSTVKRVFPVRKEILGVKASSNCDTLNRILKKFGANLSESEYTIERVAKQTPSDLTAKVTFRASGASDGEVVALDVPCGTTAPKSDPMRGFVETEMHSAVLGEMIQDHAAGSDLCILGEKGSGKSDLARLFAHRLGYATELFSLFKDMTARDLLQRRSTDSHGNTSWEDSPLIHAARNGHIAILDGVHRLGGDSLGVLQRLVQDREIDLADGTKLLAQSKYDEILSDAQESGATPALDRVFPIHPSFRVIAIAESDPVTLKASPTPGRDSTTAWLNSDSIAMFSFHHLPNLTKTQSEQVVRSLYPQLPDDTTRYEIVATLHCYRCVVALIEMSRDALQAAAGVLREASPSEGVKRRQRLPFAEPVVAPVAARVPSAERVPGAVTTGSASAAPRHIADAVPAVIVRSASGLNPERVWRAERLRRAES